jgi:MoaA/NifB/PqqE/SkfB family radical SAM enzyme
LHHRLAEVLALIASHDLGFSLVSNAWGFSTYSAKLLAHRDRLRLLDFSLDGAVAESHDANRRAGSFERVMDAARTCAQEGVRFGFRFTVTSRNLHEVEPAVELAERLGAEHLALIPMQPSDHDPTGALLPSPIQLVALSTRVDALGENRRTRVHLTTGHFNLNLFRPCASLAEESIYVTANGDLGLCCQLGGYPSTGSDEDVVGNLRETRIAEAWDRVQARAREIKRLKRGLLDEGRLGSMDYFPCWFCVKHLGRVEWLRRTGRGPWAEDLAATTEPPDRLLKVG